MGFNDIDTADFEIRQERPEDYRETEELVRNAFWNVYHPGCTEHYILHCFRKRAGFISELDLVMVRDEKIIGQVMYVHSQIDCDDGGSIPTFTFGPVSIHPDHMHKGYGRALMDHSIKMAAEMGAGAIVITGNIKYYAGSGFVPAKTKGIRYKADPDADYLLVREVKEGYLDNVHGTFSDPKGYLAAEQDPDGFEAYDKTFPEKKKLVLPGQLDF